MDSGGACVCVCVRAWPQLSTNWTSPSGAPGTGRAVATPIWKFLCVPYSEEQVPDPIPVNPRVGFPRRGCEALSSVSEGPRGKKAGRGGQGSTEPGEPSQVTSPLGASGFPYLKVGGKVSTHSQGSLRTREEMQKSSDQGLRGG